MNNYAPIFKLDIHSANSIRDVAYEISNKIIPGANWRPESSGYYEECIALELSESYLGLSIMLVEQTPFALFTLEAFPDKHCAVEAKSRSYITADISAYIKELLVCSTLFERIDLG